MNNKTKAVVKIFGSDYTLVGTESKEYIIEVCRTVDKKMREISANFTLKPMKISVLTAVNFCDEYFKTAKSLGEANAMLESCKTEIEALKDEIKALEEEKNFLKAEIRNSGKSRYNG